MKRPSKPARLLAVQQELRQLAGEYQAWRDGLPVNLQEGGLAAKLEEAVEQLEDLADEVSYFDYPQVGIAY